MPTGEWERVEDDVTLSVAPDTGTSINGRTVREPDPDVWVWLIIVGGEERLSGFSRGRLNAIDDAERRCATWLDFMSMDRFDREYERARNRWAD